MSEQVEGMPRVPPVTGHVRFTLGALLTTFQPDELPHPPLVLGTIIIPERKSAEGLLVAGVGIAWFEILAMVGRDPDAIHRIDWRQMEELIAGAYKRRGYDEVILTPRSGDRGRDIIATKRGFGAIRLLEQVKAYSPGHPVPANDVRAMIGVLNLDPGASKGLISTTSDFAPNVYTDPEIARLLPTRLELKNREQLIQWLAGTHSDP